jgi:TM2 domain-containing membrane protein YozV
VNTHKVFFCSAMKALLIIISLILTSSFEGSAQMHKKMDSALGRLLFEEVGDNTYELKSVVVGTDSIPVKEDPRLVAIALNILLGPLGVHRLYLGTDLKVPILYTLTFGGGGVVWVIDLGFLIFSKDISRFKNNKRFFMWTEHEKNNH